MTPETDDVSPKVLLSGAVLIGLLAALGVWMMRIDLNLRDIDVVIQPVAP